MRTISLSQLGFMAIAVGMAVGCSGPRMLQGDLQPAPMPPPVMEMEPLRGPGVESALSKPGYLLAARESKRYTVRKGDSLSKIAQRHGVRVREILELNSIPNPNRIRVGAVLQLPADARDVAPAPRPRTIASSGGASPAVGPGASYRIKPGDSLSVIAAKHKVTVDALRKANHLKGDRIIAGKTLIIPGEASAPAPVSVPETPIDDLVIPEDMLSP